MIRRLSVAHKIYGVPQTINTANYVYFLAYQELSALRPTVRRREPASSASSDSGLGEDSPAADKSSFPDRIIPDYDLDLVVNRMFFVVVVQAVSNIRIEELMSLHRGQGMDILWRDTLRCPSEDEYVDMVKASTLATSAKKLVSKRYFPETGGLLRIAVKLMMACSMTNTNV
jgi:geranylgeranyl diphosphate synthase type 3